MFRAPVENHWRSKSSRAISRTKRILEQRWTRTLPPTLLPMKTKIIKRKFEDQEDTRTTPDEDATADAAADAVNPSTPPHGGRSSRSRQGGGPKADAE